MASFRFSQRAEADLLGIGAYTLRNWGEEQTVRYLGDLDDAAKCWLTTPAWAETAIVSAPAYDGWRPAGTSSSTVRTLAAS